MQASIEPILALLEGGDSFLEEVTDSLYCYFLHLPATQACVSPCDEAIQETRAVFYNHPVYWKMDFELYLLNATYSWT